MSHVNKCPRCTSEGHVHVDEQSVGNKPNLLDITGTRLKKKSKNTTTLTEQGQTCASTHTRLYVFFRQFAVMKSYLKAAVPSRVCVGWSKEFVCDRLHLSFGQCQAVSAVHRQLNCSDCITLDHGFELHEHMPHSRHTIANICHQQRV